MGTFLIEDVDELIEAGLLLQEVGSGRFGGFLLQGEMHTFMTAVLLRMARLNAFDTDAQPQPPDGELAQVEQGMRRGKGNPVIAPKVGG